jgi:hypothetical protein
MYFGPNIYCNIGRFGPSAHLPRSQQAENSKMQQQTFFAMSRTAAKVCIEILSIFFGNQRTPFKGYRLDFIHIRSNLLVPDLFITVALLHKLQ